MARKLKDVDVTVGSDPEFMIWDTATRAHVSAHDFFAKYKYEICKDMSYESCYNKECKVPNMYCGHNKVSPMIGSDGSLGELRPDPSTRPLEHVDNIEMLLHEVAKNLNSHTEIRAGGVFLHPNGGKSSMGGHIHIGMNVDEINRSKQSLANYLSYYCGIPLRKIEAMQDVQERGWIRGRYGYFGQWQNKSYGVEWRMPSSWLVDKETTRAAICLAYVAAKEFPNDRKSHVTLTEQEYHNFVTGNISEIITRIEEMQYYHYYRRELEPLLQMINNDQKWDTTKNIVQYW